MTTTFANRADEAISSGQQGYIKDLLAQIADVQPGKRDELRSQLNHEYVQHVLTRQRASRWIDSLKAIRDDLRARQRELEAQLLEAPIPARRVVERRPEVPSGRYAVENEQGTLAFYRVSNQNGHYRVFVYASTAQHPIKGWQAQQTILRKIEAVGIEQAGIRFGQEMQICGKCGTSLTDEESRRLGIGPICGGRRLK
jgi:hypothetical protein